MAAQPLSLSKRAPIAAKVPEITLLFWVIKLLTTAGGEATSDYLALGSHLVGGVVEVGLLVIGLVWQFSTRRYTAAAYWFLAYAIAIFGTGVSDTLHLTFGLPYAATTISVGGGAGGRVLVLVPQRGHALDSQHHHHAAGVLLLGHRVRHLRARHRPRRLHRDLARARLPGSVFLFAVVIAIPAVAWWKFRMNAILAFWFAYVVTRPLGASVADYLSKPTVDQRGGLRRRPDRRGHDDRGRPRSLLPHPHQKRHPAAGDAGEVARSPRLN